jgi:hypothetical protein
VAFTIAVSVWAGKVATQDDAAPASRFKLTGRLAVLGMQEIGCAEARPPGGTRRGESTLCLGDPSRQSGEDGDYSQFGMSKIVGRAHRLSRPRLAGLTAAGAFVFDWSCLLRPAIAVAGL